MTAVYGDLKGKNVLVTGGASGLGFAIAGAFAAQRSNVLIIGRNEERLKAAREHLGETVSYIPFDLNNIDHLGELTGMAIDAVGEIDVLVNNAGISTVREFIKDEDLSDWHRVMATNLHGPAHTIYEVAPRMIKAGKGGVIINISSIGGQSLGGARTHPMPSYHVSKAGLDMFTRNMAIELGDYGIRVNGVAPGPTHSGLDEDLPPDALEKFENLMPMHRFAEPIEIGALCVFLSSPAANHITGTVVVHDGGLLLIA